MAHKGLCLHLQQSSERMILYRAYAAAILFPCHSYIWSTTVLYDVRTEKSHNTSHLVNAEYPAPSTYLPEF